MSAAKIIKNSLDQGVFLYLEKGDLKYRVQKGKIFSEELKELLRANKDEIKNYLSLNGGDKFECRQIYPKLKRDGMSPLSFAQQRLWFIEQLHGSSSNYNVPMAMRVFGEFDLDSAVWALKQIIERHEILRTVYQKVSGEAVQVVKNEVEFKLTQIDLRTKSHEEQEKQVRQLAEEDAHLGFDLENDIMLRATWLKLRGHRHQQQGVLLLNTHHIASDAWSMNILINEFMTLYQAYLKGDTVQLPPLEIQYADYASWQRDLLQEEGIDKQLQYWNQQLVDVPIVHSIPLDYKRPKKSTSRGKEVIAELSPVVTSQVTQLAQKLEVTPFMLLHAALSILLSRHANNTDVVIGTPVSNRLHPQIESLIGFFVNTLVLRTNCAGFELFSDFLNHVRQVNVDAQANQDIPFEQIVEQSKIQRSAQHAPLFQILFNVDTNEQVDRGLEGLSFAPLEGIEPVAKFDLNINAHISDGGLLFTWVYDTELFSHERIEAMSEQLCRLVVAICENPHSDIEELPILSQHEQNFLIHQINETEMSWPLDISFHRMFEKQVALNGNALAIRYCDQALTYHELNDKANRLANYLLEEEFGVGDRIGICIERSIAQLIAVLAVMKTGATYVPLMDNAGNERLSFIIEDAVIDLVLLSSDMIAKLPLSDIDVFDMDDAITDDWLEEQDNENPNIIDKVEGVPYILYTSGTTGTPKGVMVSHRGLSNYLYHGCEHYIKEELGGSIVSSPLYFDATITSLMVPLCVGKPVELLEQSDNTLSLLYKRLLNSEFPLLFKVTPAHLEALYNLKQTHSPSNIEHTIVVGGETLPLPLLQRWQHELLPNATFINEYGPTETVVGCSYYKVKGHQSSLEVHSEVPIGRPIGNTKLFVLNSSMQLSPKGCVGELYIGGAGVAFGYLAQPALSKKQFIDNPFSDTSPLKLYKTGDLVRYLEDGNLAFLGRVDDQVKIRGYRVELSEIRHQLDTLPEVDSSFVVNVENKKLGAYVKPQYDLGNIIERDFIHQLKSRLSEKLPDYMVPSVVILLDKWPLTNQGKIDKKALPAPDGSFQVDDYIAPQTEVEKALVEVWSGLLHIEASKISSNASFFELGGHSLLSIRLMSIIKGKFGVDLPVKAVFDSNALSDLAAEIESNTNNALLTQVRPIARSGEYYDVSFSQQRLWFIDQLQGGSAEYNMPMAFEVQGQLELALVTDVFSCIIERHEVLRTEYIDLDGEAKQRIRPMSEVTFSINEIDLCHLTGETQREDIKVYVEADIITPFDLAHDVMLRVSYLRTAKDAGVLLFNMHHIASDGWSMEVLTREFFALYDALSQGKPSSLPELDIQYADYAHWQQTHLAGEALDKQLDYWVKQLDEVPAVHSLPLSYPRPEAKSHVGAIVNGHLSAKVSQKLQALAKQHQLTPFMLLHGALSLLLSRHSNSNDIVIGTPVANRLQAELEPLIGFFVNTLVLRADTQHDTVSDYLSHIRQVHLDAQSNQDVPFEQLVERLNIPRSTAHSPLFQIMLSTNTDYGLNNDAIPEAMSLPGVTLSPYQSDIIQAKFDLSIGMSISDDGIGINWTYDVSLFDEANIQRLNDHLCRLLTGLSEVTTAEQPLSELPMLSKEEEYHLITELNDTAMDYPKDKCIHELFEQQAQANPDNIAVVFEDEQLTYQALNTRANQLAHYLVETQGVTPDTLVGLCVERSLEMVIGILGILKAGGAYVPLDPSYPKERLAYMMDDAKLTTIVSHTQAKGALSEYSGHIIDLENTAHFDGYSTDNVDKTALGLTSSHLAYVIYTSGSTGKPKGVLTEHLSLINFSSGFEKQLKVCGNTKNGWLWLSSFAFDASLKGVTQLASGVKLIIPSKKKVNDPASIVSIILEHNLNIINATPQLLEMIIQEQSMRGINIISSGDKIGASTFKLLLEFASRNGVNFINAYGPTEATVNSTYILQNNLDKELIGHVMPNTSMYVLDTNEYLTPRGCIGELYIGGDGLARGYLNRPELTSERFIDNPYYDSSNPNSSQRLYRTGDLVRYLPDGNLEFIGRVDEQVKIRGFRIELGEVESQLSAQSSVDSALVMVKKLVDCQQLVGYIKPVNDVDEDNQASLIAEIKAGLSVQLPDYMVPNMIVVVNKWPLTQNGKVDRKALPEPFADALAGQRIEPVNGTQCQLIEIWANLLGVDSQKLSITDNFFALGGHSILVIRLINQIRRVFAVEISISVIFQSANLSDLANAVEQQQRAILLPKIVRREPGLKIPLSYAQQRLWFIDRIDNGSPQYNMQNMFKLNGQLNAKAFYKAIESIIYRHEILRTRYGQDGNGAEQYIIDEFTLPIEQVDLTLMHSVSQNREVERLTRHDQLKAFDLFKQLPLRVVLIKLSNDSHVILFNVHHIAADGWSLQVLNREFVALYNAYKDNLPNPLDPLSIQYADYALWQRSWFCADNQSQYVDYWMNRLSAIPEVHSLPLDKPRTVRKSMEGASCLQVFKPEFGNRLDRFCKEHNVTLFMLLHTVFSLMVSKLSQIEDVVIGTQVAGRNDEKLEGLIGLFVNTIAIRHKFDLEVTFEQYLASARQQFLADFEYQDMPFDSLVEKINPNRNTEYAPLVQIMFSLVEQVKSDDDIQGVIAQELESGIDLAQYDLVVNVEHSDQQTSLSWIYDSTLFNADTIANLMGKMECLLSNAISTPASPVYSLAMLDLVAVGKINKMSQGPHIPLCGIETVHGLFEHWVDKQPDAAALTYKDKCISYGELNDKANRLARMIVESEIDHGVKVGILMPRSQQMLLTVLATMKAGATYVPLDIKLPQERVNDIVVDAEIDTVITMTELMEHQSLVGLDVITIDEAFDDEDWMTEYDHTNLSDDEVFVHADSSIYVLYTSGSTGKPKGIDVHHGGVVNYLNYARNNYIANDVSGSVVSSALSFDATITTLLTPLVAGKSVHLLPDMQSPDLTDLAQLLFQSAESKLFKITPAHLGALLHYATKAVNDKVAHVIVIGGEQLHTELLIQYRTLLPNCIFVNEYGPTETVVGCCSYFVRPKDSITNNLACPIGRAIDNTQLLVLDQGMQIQSTNSIGELFIGGAGVTKGYVNRTQLNAEKFIESPFDKQPLYRSGDLVRWLADGNLEFVGRVDSQVKLRGFRVELGEIENGLRQSPCVVESVAKIQTTDNNEQELVAYCTVDKDYCAAAYNITQLLSTSQIDAQELYTLPNGMEIVGLNKAETEYLYEEIFVEDIYAKHNIELTDGDVIFDVGANIGMYSIALASRLDVQVYSFEPIPTIFSALEKNALIYGGDKIKTHQFGLSDSVKDSKFTFYPNVSLFSGVAKGREDNIDIIKRFLVNKEQESIDKYDVSDESLQQLIEQRLEEETLVLPLSTISAQMKSYGLDRIDLLKIDVERSEMDVLRGIEKKDWVKIRQVVIEIHDVQDNLAQAEELLTLHGFTITKEQLSELEGTELVNLYATRDNHKAARSPVLAEKWQGRQAVQKMLERHLKRTLPEYMMPSKFKLLHKFEVTDNGKIDRTKLGTVKNLGYKPHRSPTNEIEQTLCLYWQNLLRLEKVSIDESFFELGGHSLLVIRLISMIREEFDLELTIKNVFDNPTIANIAVHINQQINLRKMEEKLAQFNDGEINEVVF